LTGLLLFQKELNETGHRDLLAAGQEIVRVYERTRPDDPEGYIASMSALSSYDIRIDSPEGRTAYYSPNPGKPDGQGLSVSPEAVRTVLGGEIYRSSGGDEETFVGLPIGHDGERYALFLRSSSKNEPVILRLLLAIVAVALFVGGSCVLLGAKYIVNPIKALTEATKKIAQGNYDLSLGTKRKDEIGVLSRSFGEMATAISRLETMRKEFVSNVSHEIQSPLTSISGFAQALKNPLLVPEEERAQILDVIVAESARLSRLGDHLLKLASLESERPPLEFASFRLDEQLRRVVTGSEPQWAAKGLDVDAELPEKPVTVVADRELLNQVWTNLLGNGIKFTPGGGRVTIRLSLDPNASSCAVSFEDSGIGIPPEQLGRVFDRFFKGDASRSGGGNGLGLAIASKIVDLHGGRIEIGSVPGEGTTVTVRLPLRPPEPIVRL